MNTFQLFIIVPASVWVLSYVHLAIFHKKVNLLNVKIHESGKYTLLETIFYYDHFIREIFIDTFYALGIFWTYSSLNLDIRYLNSSNSNLLILLTFLALIFFASFKKVGIKNTIQNLFQRKELDHVSSWGAHWKMHFLSTLAMIMILILPGRFSATTNYNFLVLTIALFAIASLIFKTNIKTFQNKIWTLHGAREIFTFIFLALIPSFLPFFNFLNLEFTPVKALLGLIVLKISLHMIKTYKNSNVKELSRGKIKYDHLGLLTNHFFEHFLDFVYITLLVLTLMST